MRDGNKKIILKRGDVGGKGEVTKMERNKMLRKEFQ